MSLFRCRLGRRFGEAWRGKLARDRRNLMLNAGLEEGSGAHRKQSSVVIANGSGWIVFAAGFSHRDEVRMDGLQWCGTEDRSPVPLQSLLKGLFDVGSRKNNSHPLLLLPLRRSAY